MKIHKPKNVLKNDQDNQKSFWKKIIFSFLAIGSFVLGPKVQEKNDYPQPEVVSTVTEYDPSLPSFSNEENSDQFIYSTYIIRGGKIYSYLPGPNNSEVPVEIKQLFDRIADDLGNILTRTAEFVTVLDFVISHVKKKKEADDKEGQANRNVPNDQKPLIPEKPRGSSDKNELRNAVYQSNVFKEYQTVMLDITKRQVEQVVKDIWKTKAKSEQEGISFAEYITAVKRHKKELCEVLWSTYEIWMELKVEEFIRLWTTLNCVPNLDKAP